MRKDQKKKTYRLDELQRGRLDAWCRMMNIAHQDWFERMYKGWWNSLDKELKLRVDRGRRASV